MATMYPNNLPQEAKISHAEKTVFSALKKQLPDNYRVYHSFHWTEDNNIPREADFIVVNPDKGFIVLEVKGGNISVESGQWYTTNTQGKSRIDNPFRQAQRSMYFLLEQFKKSRGCVFKGIYSCAVFFPDTSKDASYIYSDMTEHNTLFNQHLDDIRDKIENLFRYTAYDDKDIDKAHIDFLSEMLTPSLHLKLSLRAALEKQQEEINKLDYFQDYLLDLLEDKKRVAFQGTAGTGKTWIALKKAVRLVKQGKDCLLLCYNKELKEKLRQMAEDMLREEISQGVESPKIGSLDVYNFHGYANHVFKGYLEFLLDNDARQQDIFADVTRRFYPDRSINKVMDFIGLLSGEEEKKSSCDILAEYDDIDYRLNRFLQNVLQDSDDGYFEFNVPVALLDILEDESYEAERYDAIIIDEAQDFKKTWCDCIEKLFEKKRNRIVYIFYDDNQNIFCAKKNLPIIELVDRYNLNPYLYRLRKNIRNTRAIHKYAIEETELGKTSEAIDIEGISPVIMRVKSEGEARSATAKILTELIDKNKIDKKRIIVLTDTSVKKSVFAESKKAGVFKLTEKGKGERENLVRIRSVRKFKGLESDVVILIEHGQDYQENKNELLYVAYTRARFLLYVIRIEV